MKQYENKFLTYFLPVFLFLFGGIFTFVSSVPLFVASIVGVKEMLYVAIPTMIIGLLSIGGGVVCLVRTGKKKKNQLNLRENGLKILASFTGVDYATHIRINGRNPMYLVCNYHDGRTTYVFKSGYIKHDPTPYIQNYNVPVYYEAGNINNYYVDVNEFLGGTVQYL